MPVVGMILSRRRGVLRPGRLGERPTVLRHL